MPTPQPPHPLHALTTSELNRYRRDLEQALRGLTGHDPDRQGPDIPPSPAGGGPALVAAELARQLTRAGITGIYTATTAKFAVISVTAGLTVWTNGHQLWCTRQGQHRTWPAADLAAAAAGIAALARP
jgi:hypothetical protein